MKVAFSGESRLVDQSDASDRVMIAINLIEEVPTDVFTGGAYGIDTIAALAAVIQWPRARHHLVVPEGYHWNRGLLDEFPGEITVHWIQGGYMKRNDALITDANVLLAFPATEVEQVRSGTWATVRRARKRGLDVRIYPLNS